MNYRFHPPAEVELYAAQSWYEDQRAGLGEAFLLAVTRALESIVAAPDAYGRWPGVSASVRRYVLPRFPYALPYLVQESCVDILAVSHASRRPAYWLDRVA